MFFHMNAWCRYRYRSAKELYFVLKTNWPAAEASPAVLCLDQSSRATASSRRLAEWLLQNIPTLDTGIYEATAGQSCFLDCMDAAWYILRRQGMPELQMNVDSRGLLENLAQKAIEAPVVVKVWEALIHRPGLPGRKPHPRDLSKRKTKCVYVSADEFDTFLDRMKARLPHAQLYPSLPPGPEIY